MIKQSNNLRMRGWVGLACAGLLYACSANDGGSAAAPSSDLATRAAGTSAVADAAGGGAGASSAGAGGIAPAVDSGVAGADVVDAAAADSGAVGSVVADAGGSATDAGPSTFSNVLAILAAHGCGGCHGDPPGQGDGGLSFYTSQKDTAYAALVGVQSAGGSASVCGGKTYVVPGSPDMSLLYDKLANAAPSCGGRMPASGMPLSAAELASLRGWISAGALND